MRYRDPKKESVLQKYYGLSDEKTEFQIMDRFSFLQFLDLQAGGRYAVKSGLQTKKRSYRSNRIQHIQIITTRFNVIKPEKRFLSRLRRSKGVFQKSP